jgi:hypothetical protein
MALMVRLGLLFLEVPGVSGQQDPPISQAFVSISSLV